MGEEILSQNFSISSVSDTTVNSSSAVQEIEPYTEARNEFINPTKNKVNIENSNEIRVGDVIYHYHYYPNASSNF